MLNNLNLLAYFLLYEWVRVCVLGPDRKSMNFNISKSIKITVFIFLFLITSCLESGSVFGPTQTGISSNTGQDGGITNSASGDANNESGVEGISISPGEGSSDTNFDSGTDTLPTTAIPLPMLQSDKLLTYNNDSSGNFPVVAQAGAVTDFDEGDQIAISSTVFTAQEESIYSSFLVSTAHAAEDACANPDFHFCDIEADGSFECFVNPGMSPTSFYYTVVDENCDFKTETVVEDPVQENLLYLASVPTDVGIVEDDLFSLTDSKGVKVAEDGGKLKVFGNFQQNYQNFETTGGKISYASSDSLVATMNPVSGIELFPNTSGTIGTPKPIFTMFDTLPVIRSYTFLKPVNGIMYFGFEPEVATDEGYLMYATTEDLWNNVSYKKIWFTKNNDTDSSGHVINHTKTLAFDSVQLGAFTWTIVAFQDHEDIRIKAIKTLGMSISERLSGDIWKTTTEVDIEDIVVWYDDDVENILFAILDSMKNKVTLGRVNVNGIDPLKIFDNKSILVGENPRSMVYSKNSGKLYVLNQNDQSISVIPLMLDESTSVKFPEVSKVIYLSDSVPGKTISFRGNSIQIKEDVLVVSDEMIKALVLIDVSDEESNLADP